MNGCGCTYWVTLSVQLRNATTSTSSYPTKVKSEQNWPKVDLFGRGQGSSLTDPAPVKHFPDLNCSSLSLDITWNTWCGQMVKTTDSRSRGCRLESWFMQLSSPSSPKAQCSALCLVLERDTKKLAGVHTQNLQKRRKQNDIDKAIGVLTVHIF